LVIVYRSWYKVIHRDGLHEEHQNLARVVSVSAEIRNRYLVSTTQNFTCQCSMGRKVFHLVSYLKTRYGYVGTICILYMLPAVAVNVCLRENMDDIFREELLTPC
jgi:hypothetical protein